MKGQHGVHILSSHNNEIRIENKTNFYENAMSEWRFGPTLLNGTAILSSRLRLKLWFSSPQISQKSGSLT